MAIGKVLLHLQGKFRNKIIEDVTHDLWFHDVNTLSFKYPSDFTPLKNETMGLIFTAVEYELSLCVASGKRLCTIKFQSSKYTIYDALLTKICQFEADDSAVWLQTHQKISNNAKAAHSKNAQDEENQPPTDDNSAEE
ncbi:hypothetical protein OF83DRAFT_1088300, partial [Amylostereum chailletii]